MLSKIIGIVERPLIYAPGSIFDSRATKNISDSPNYKNGIMVGTCFIPSDDIRCFIIRELYTNCSNDQVIINRYYLKTKNENFIPVYIRAGAIDFDFKECSVLLLRSGLEQALRTLTDDDIKLSLVDDYMFHVIRNDMIACTDDLSDVLNNWYYSRGNERCNFVNNDQVPQGVDTNLVAADIPWRRICVDKQGKLNTVRNMSQPKNVVTNTIRWITGGWSNLSEGVKSTFAPKFVREYLPSAVDNITSEQNTAGIVDKPDLMENYSITPFKLSNKFTIDKSKLAEYVPVTQFTSELMDLCILVHELSISQLYLKYILPTRYEDPGKIVACSENFITLEDKMELTKNLSWVFENWNRQVKTVELIYSDEDILYLHLSGDNYDAKYSVDMFASVLLTHNLTNVDGDLNV